MSFNYRFSVIPAGAIIDERLRDHPRALQVLCLLGRHTNDAGWCSRSQVKMAKELGCSRSTIYDAVEILLEAQWIEKRANGRGGRSAESADHPFAAYSYRVILDRDALPARLTSEDQQPENTGEGAGTAAGGAAEAAGGADTAAPLEGISTEGISSQPEREPRASENGKLAKLKSVWPTTAFDDQDQIARAWLALPEEKQAKALDRAADYLDGLKRARRSHPPSLAKYLGQSLFDHLPDKPETEVPTISFLRAGTPEWRAYHVACAIGGEDSKGDAKGVRITGPIPHDAEALAAFASDDGTVDTSAWSFLYVRDRRIGAANNNADSVERDKRKVAAWRARVKEWTGRVPDGKQRKIGDVYVPGLCVPMPWPASKRGQDNPEDLSAA